MNKGMNMTNLTLDEQKTLLESRFPRANSIVFNCYNQWDVTEIIGEDDWGDEVIDSYVYVPGTSKFKFIGTISVEI